MKKVKVGIAGLGRLGKVHAHNIAYKRWTSDRSKYLRTCTADGIN